VLSAKKLKKSPVAIEQAQSLGFEVNRKSRMQQIKEQKFLILMALPFVIWILIFAYIPIIGWVMAFQNYRPHLGFFGSEWVGFYQFQNLFESRLFFQALRNTLAMGIMGLVFGFLSTITFAILINELRFTKFKRITQTVSYLPHFVSWVIVANLVITMLSPSGAINELLLFLGIIDAPIHYMAQPGMFWWIITFAEVWKSTGWGAIIYLAAMAGIDPGLYEAAEVDGANRWRKIWHITLPGIRPTIIVLIVMSIGNLINIGFERQMLLGNNIVASQAMVIDRYALDFGIGMFRLSYGTAIGIFRSVISIILLFLANGFAKKIGEGRIM
jgi:putative aldouronate transport system permease protein